MLIIAATVVSITLAISLYVSRRGTTTEQAKVKIPGTPSTNLSVIQSKNLSPEYLKIISQSSREEAEKALKEGKSSVPMIIEGEKPTIQPAERKETGEPCTVYCATQANPTDLLNRWSEKGQVSPGALSELERLQNAGAPISSYVDALNRLVKSGAITPQQAKQLLQAYQKQLAEKSSRTADDVTNELEATGDIPPAAAAQLRKLNNSGMSANDYQNALNGMVARGEISADQAKKLLDTYKATGGKQAQPEIPTAPETLLENMRKSGEIPSAEANDALKKMITENTPATAFAGEINRLVKENKLPAEAAKKLLTSYSEKGMATVAPEDEVGKLKRQTDLQELEKQKAELNKIESEQERQKAAIAHQEEQALTQEAASNMGTQARALIAAWNPTPQQYQSILALEDKTAKEKEAADGIRKGKKQPPIIKAGTILFAVLDTKANSDRPGPIMATITMGNYKGARVLRRFVNNSRWRENVIAFSYD